MTDDYLLKGYTLEYLLSVKDKEFDMYPLLYNICTAVLNRQEGSYFDYETDFDYAFISEFWNVGGDTRFRKFDYIPRDEFLLIMAKVTLQILKTRPESPKVKSLKEASLGRFKDYLPNDKKEMLDYISGLEFSDVTMLVKLQDHLRQYPSVYKQPASIETEQVIEPPKPPEPKKQGGKISLWLDWYHAMLGNGYKCTLEDVARKSGYSLGYIKQRHMVYQAKPTQKT